MTEITIENLQNLITHFAKNTYRTKDADVTSQEIMQRCMLLAAYDYEYSTINNSGGDLCAHYPSYLIMLEHEKLQNSNNGDTMSSLCLTESTYENIPFKNKLKKLMTQSRFARCRSRFPVPVILYKGRHVCRSATLSSSPEMFGRAGLDFLLSSIASGSASLTPPGTMVDQNLFEDEPRIIDLKNKVRYYDIELLKALNVGTIVDFMVEKKKIKYGMTVTSSEKVDQEKRYNAFNLISLPYPGCEFFKEFRDQDYRSKGLVFDWYQNYVDAPICVPEDFISSQLRINWNRYTEWDLVKLTQNYLKLILRYLSESSTGILIHCISGWDRTPLFISLLRISLWADEVIHTTLNSYQILYYTIAYDWMLFGHDLADRLNKGEEILFFCFDFLKYIENEHFSIHKRYERVSRHSESQSETVLVDGLPFEFLMNSSFSPKNSSPSSIEQISGDSDTPATVFSTDFHECQDESRNNVNVIPGTFNASPNKEGSAAQGSRSSLCANRTSPIGVPISRNTRVRQRKDSSSSGESWQWVTGTGSLCGSTTANASHTENINCKASCTTCMTQRTLTGFSTTVNDDEASGRILITQRKERLHCLRNIFYKAYGPHGFRLKDELGGISQYIGNIVGMTST